MKFSEDEFAIDKAYARRLRERRELLRRVTKTRKSLFLIFVTTHGLKSNPHALEFADASITLDDLFI